MWRLASVACALTFLIPFTTVEAKELGAISLTDVQIEQSDKVSAKEVEVIRYTIALTNDAKALDTVTIQLPESVKLAKTAVLDVKNTEGRVAAKATFNAAKNQVLLTLNDVAEATTYSDLLAEIPVIFNETKAGDYTAEFAINNGTKELAYTVVAEEVPATVEAKGQLMASTISWVVTIDASGATLTNAQLESAFEESYDLKGPVTVTYEQADGTTTDKKFTSRLLADRTLKLNLGTIQHQVVTIAYDTTVQSTEKKYTNELMIHSLNNDDFVTTATVDGTDAVVVNEEPNETIDKVNKPVTESTGEKPLAAGALTSNATSSSDVITKQSDSGNTLTELPQTGVGNPAWLGVGLVGVAYVLLRRRK